MRMEKYYYFTTLSVGVSFIENVDASSLNMDPVAFEKYVPFSPPLSFSLLSICVVGCVMSFNIDHF